MSEDDVRELLTKRAKPCAINRGSTGVTAWAKQHGISKGHVSEFMRGKRLPTTAILDALNLEWRIVRKARKLP